MRKQSLLRFAVEAQSTQHSNASAWKRAIGAAWAHDTPIPWDSLYISTSATALTLGAARPDGSDFLDEHVAQIMGVVADVAGRMLLVESTSLTPALEFKGTAWQYSIPKLVVAKPSDKDWAEWRADELSAELTRLLEEQIRKDLHGQFQTWALINGARPPQLQINITDVGRSMILKSSIQASAKPVSVLARLGVTFTCNARFEGGFFAGPLKGLGYGRIYRTGMQTE